MAITTDIIVGFPGETKEDVDETIDVIRRVKYDNAFTFIYSKRTGTPAAAMEQVPEEQVKEQFDRVLKTVQETAREQVSRYQGQIADVLVEEINENDRSMVTGRMSNNTLVHFQGDASLVGKIVSKEWEAEGIRKGIEQGIERGIEQGIEQGSEKKELEMYQTMVDKGFSISSIASIFSVSEESIERLLMKA